MLVAFARSRHGTEPFAPACPVYSRKRARGAWREWPWTVGFVFQTPATGSIPDTGYPRPRLLDFGTDLASLFAQTPAPVPDEFPMAAPRQQSPLSIVNPKVKGRTFMSNVSKAGGDDHNNATTRNTFGSSVESQAQISDAAAAGASGGEAEKLSIYRLEPIAAPGDPRWVNSPGHGVVMVAARTSGDARIVAASRELDFMEVDAAPAEDVTTFNASAFRDDKLYTVIEVERGRTDIARGVIKGEISVDTIRPVQPD